MRASGRRSLVIVAAVALAVPAVVAASGSPPAGAQADGPRRFHGPGAGADRPPHRGQVDQREAGPDRPGPARPHRHRRRARRGQARLRRRRQLRRATSTGLAPTSPKVTGPGPRRPTRRPSRPTTPTPPASSPASWPPCSRRCRRRRVGVRLREVYGGVAVSVPANQHRHGAHPARRGRRPARLAPAPADRRQPRLHRRAHHLGPGGRPGQRRQGPDLRQPRHRHLARAPVVRRRPAPSARRRPRPTARRARACSATTRSRRPTIRSPATTS